jgi:hypothetical protein
LALQPADSFGGGDVVHVAHSAYVHLLRISAVGQAAEEIAPQETVKVGGYLSVERALARQGI